MMNVEQIMLKHHISLCLEGNAASIAIRWPSRFFVIDPKASTDPSDPKSGEANSRVGGTI